MKKVLFISISILYVLASSCSKDNGPLIMSPLEKLQGEWYYNKAFFVSNNGIFREDVMNEFVDSRVTIDGNTIPMTNLRTGQILEGTFDLYKDDVGGYWDENGNYIADIERFMSIYVFDTQTNQRYIYDWQINYLTRNKFNVGENYANGNYSLKMKKLE